MGLVVSLIVIAVGAILTWAVRDTSGSVDIDVVGVILMIVGLVGFLLSLFFWSTWAGPGYFRRAMYVEGAPPAPRRYWPYRGGRRARYVEDESAPPPGPPGPPPP